MLKFLLAVSRRYMLVMILLIAGPTHGQTDNMQESESVFASRTASHKLHAAVRSGDARAVEHELAGGVDINKSMALELAIRLGHDDVLDLLTSRGADVNRPGLGGEPPITLAVRRGRPDMVRRLLAHGADVSLPDRRGLTAMDHVRMGGHPDMAEILERRNPGAHRDGIQTGGGGWIRTD